MCVLYVCYMCVRHVSDTHDVVTRGELRMSDREYVLDHTPPWVNNLCYMCVMCMLYMCYMCVRHVCYMCVRHVLDTHDVVTRDGLIRRIMGS